MILLLRNLQISEERETGTHNTFSTVKALLKLKKNLGSVIANKGIKGRIKRRLRFI